MADNIKEIKIEARGLKEIKRELDEIKDSMKSVTDPEEMNRLIDSVSKLETELDGVNNKMEELGETSEGSLNNAGKGFKDFKRNLSDLNFKAIQSQVEAFGKSSNVSFKGAIKGIKSMSKTFIQAGKKLLTNPYLRLAAVIIGIIVVVYKFLDSLGLISVAIDLLMAPIQYIIDLFYMLTDAIGLTNEAATAEAQDIADAYQSTADSLNKSTESIVQDLNHQINVAKSLGEDTVDLEREKQMVLIETARANNEAAEEQVKANEIANAKKKKLTDEEIEKQNELAESYRKTTMALKGEVNKQIEFEVKLYADNEKQREIDIASDEKAIQDKKSLNEKAYQDRLDREKKFQQNRLNAIRLNENLELQLMEEGIEKELAINKSLYERLIEDTESNVSLSEEEKIKVKAKYQDILDQKEEEIREESNQKTIDSQKELDDLLFEMSSSKLERDIRLLEDQEQEKADILEAKREEGLISQEDYNNALLELELEFENRKKNLAKGDDEEELTPEEEAEIKLERQREFLEAGLITVEEFAKREIDIEREKAEAIKAIALEQAEAKIDAYESYASTINDLAGAIFEIGNNLGDQSVEAQEKRAKKQFKIQKALNLVMAGIDGARAIVTSLALAPVAAGVVPNPAGIASLALVATSTAATLAAIASKQYGGGGGSVPPTPSVGSIPTADSQPRQAPVVNFSGTGNDSNDVNAGGGSSTIIINNDVSVSETEMTDKQKTVKNLTSMGQL